MSTEGTWTQHVPLLCCPRCEAQLAGGDAELRCPGCGQVFEIEGGIPRLFWPNDWPDERRDVTEVVRAFYEETPFPNYDEFDSVESLIQKARRGRFAQHLDDDVPPGARILEVGCGTGQLSNFLSIANRTVFGSDLCLNSLRLGQDFKQRNGLARVHFLQMNLFRPVFRPGSFDLVISNGVLHHTADPRLGFETIARLARPGGYVLIGLYHRYGRLITDTRRLLFRLLGERLSFLDPNLRRAESSPEKRRAWFMDQYRHPHESKHTIGEVLGWLRQGGWRFVRSIPGARLFESAPTDASLFAPETPGGGLERALAELGQVFRGSREGGFFVVIAQRPEASEG